MTIHWTPELEDEILEWVSQGKGLASYLRQDGKPSRKSILRYADEVPEFATKYARARIVGVEAELDKMRELDEKLERGEIEPQAHASLSNNIKWRAAKLNRKQYGDKLDLTADDKPLLMLTDEQLFAKFATASSRMMLEAPTIDVTPEPPDVE